MLIRMVVFAGVVAAIATQVPSFFEKNDSADISPKAVLNVATPQQPIIADAQGNVRLKADAQGHYNGDFKINGKSVPGLIDTGATYVAINETTARHLGFSGNDLNYKYSVNTANGATKAAYV